MKQYSEYKDSGVEWIGEIPSEWKKLKIKNIFTESNTINTEGNTNYLSIVKDKGVVLYSDKGNVGNKTSDHPEKYKMVEVDDIVINPMNIIIGSVGRSNYEGCLSSVYIVLKSNNEVSSNYYEYIFSHKSFQKYLKRICYGIMELRESLNKIEFYVEELTVPPLQEQQQISDYLNYKTSKIDKLIEKTEQKIDLLKEQRISLINTTVTKGLNPNVEMKDTGVEWIGEIPSEWSVKKLKYTCNITYGISPSDTTYNDKGQGEILINGPVEYSKEGFGYTRSTKWTTDPKKFTEKGSLLFCLRGSTTGRMNITHDYVSIGRGVCSLISKESQWFMIYSMFIVKNYIQGEISGSTFPSVTKDDVDNYFICTPPLQEQQQIVDYLDVETSKIDKLVDIESKRIRLLKEYRQSIISDVVTGKVDVRDEVLV